MASTLALDPYYKAVTDTMVYVGIGVSIPTNIINMIVFSRPAFSKLGVSVFMRNLSAMEVFIFLLLLLQTNYFMQLSPSVAMAAALFIIPFYVASSWSQLFMGMERAVAACSPAQGRKLFGDTPATILCLATLLICLILFVPTSLQYFMYPIPMEIVRATFYTFVPSLSILVFSLVTAIKQVRSGGLEEEEEEEERCENMKQQHSITMMLVVTNFIFCLLTVPAEIYFLASSHSGAGMAGINLTILCVLYGLQLGNHGLKLVFYLFSGALYRQELWSIVTHKPCSNLRTASTAAAVSTEDVGQEQANKSKPKPDVTEEQGDQTKSEEKEEEMQPKDVKTVDVEVVARA